MKELLRNFVDATIFLLVVLWLFVIALMAGATPAKADGVAALEPTYLAMDVYRIESYYDSYFPGLRAGDDKDGATEFWSYGSAVKFDWNLWRAGDYRMYWRNNVHMSATNRQVRHVGWEWDAGLNMHEKVELFYHHHSQHGLDYVPPPSVSQMYPLLDTWGVRFILLQK